MEENKNVYSTLCIVAPDDYETYNGVVLEITDGKRVVMQLKSDGTLLLANVHVINVAEIISCQTPDDGIGGNPISGIG